MLKHTLSYQLIANDTSKTAKLQINADNTFVAYHQNVENIIANFYFLLFSMSHYAIN